MDKSEVLFKCTECNYEETKPKLSPSTGIAHGNGWKYTCPICRGKLTLEQLPDSEEG